MYSITKLLPKDVKEKLKPIYSVIVKIQSFNRKKRSFRLVTNKIKEEALINPIFIIATPGNLHIIKLCLKFVPPGQNCIIILNGLDSWEKDWAYSHFGKNNVIVSPYLFDHAMVIDYLLTWMKKPFGLLDFDCFVFDPTCFTKLLYLPERTIFSAYYFYNINCKLGLTIPKTFFFFLNTPIINKIKRQYKIDSSGVMSWDKLPVMARKKLLSVGLTNRDFPYFDTLRVIMAIGFAEGYQFYFPDGHHTLRSDRLYHVGAVASVSLRGIRMDTWYNARGSYFWFRALESTDDAELQERYYKTYGYMNPSDLLKLVPDSYKDEFERNDFLLSIDRIVNSHEL